MHICYALYVLMCCMQPALFILSMALNKHLTCRVTRMKPPSVMDFGEIIMTNDHFSNETQKSE